MTTGDLAEEFAASLEEISATDPLLADTHDEHD
jgi:hypothetical protein